MTHNATLKASIVTALFTGFGLIGWITGGQWRQAVPFQIALFILLLVHTFFSVRCFSALINPKDWRQIGIDLVLVLHYLGLGLNLSKDKFIFWWIGLFVFASLKYVFLVGRLHYPILLRRKLTADIAGIGFMIAVWYSWIGFGLRDGAMILFQWGPLGMSWFEWMWIGVFAAATIYYLFVRPLYVPDKQAAL